MVREGQPKYRQIAGDLRARIESGEYAPGDRLPSKAELMKRHDVALNTVDSAVRVLRELGLAETRQGTGTYVCDPLPDAGPDLAEQVRRLAERMDAAEAWIAGHRADELSRGDAAAVLDDDLDGDR